jgi:Xaa-Pro aminopeptidase
MPERRVCRLQKALEDAKIDIFLATHTADICWLTGFADVFDEEQAHLALVARGGGTGEANAADVADVAGADGLGGATGDADAEGTGDLLPLPPLPEPLLFTDTRYSTALRSRDTKGRWRVLDERRPRFAYVAETLRQWLGDAAGEQGRHAETPGESSFSGPLRIGIDADMRLDSFRALSQALEGQDSQDGRDGLRFELVELPQFITTLRAVKDEQEIAALRAAQAITDAAFTHMLGYLRPGITEREAAVELEFFMRRAGASGLAFPSIVASGPNSALPHAVPSDRVFQRGDFVLMDFGARLADYRSDMTRTVVLGPASEQQRAMYAAVLEAQTSVIEALKPGMSGKEAQEIAEKVIAAHGFEGRFTHSLGHGVGIDIHELPLLASKVETALEAGQVVTVEPGVYFDGVGGVRIEDFGVITEHGFSDFTQSPHELIEL